MNIKIRTLIATYSLGLLAAVLVVLSGCATAHKSASALQGTWTGREIGVNAETPRLLILSGKQFEYRGAAPQDWGKATFVVREDTEPKQLVVTITECGYPQYVGKTAVLIYKLEDGTLTAAATEPGTPPASSFDSSEARRMVFKKQ